MMMLLLAKRFGKNPSARSESGADVTGCVIYVDIDQMNKRFHTYSGPMTC